MDWNNATSGNLISSSSIIEDGAGMDVISLRLVIVTDSGERYLWGLVTGEQEMMGRGNLRKSITDISLSGRIHAQISWGTLGNSIPSAMSDVGGKLFKIF